MHLKLSFVKLHECLIVYTLCIHCGVYTLWSLESSGNSYSYFFFQKYEPRGVVSSCSENSRKIAGKRPGQSSLLIKCHPIFRTLLFQEHLWLAAFVSQNIFVFQTLERPHSILTCQVKQARKFIGTQSPLEMLFKIFPNFYAYKLLVPLGTRPKFNLHNMILWYRGCHMNF